MRASISKNIELKSMSSTELNSAAIELHLLRFIWSETARHPTSRRVHHQKARYMP